ncbi:MAG: hypothetical protein P8Y12_02710 [Gammaproteobacteria bacterium]|jgi:hypothetical protein
MNGRFVAAAFFLPLSCLAAPWEFDSPVRVTVQDLEPHFHHLDGSGRRHLASGDNNLALVWEDDRSGTPQVYAAVKALAEGTFTQEFQLSTGEEAYEPALVSIDGDRFVAAWEQDNEIWSCLITELGISPAVNLSTRPAKQVALAADSAGNVAAVWADIENRNQTVVAVPLTVGDGSITSGSPIEIAPIAGEHYQGYPATAFTADQRLAVAWEDRRAGHTRLFASWRESQNAFSSAFQINEHRSPDPSLPYSAGKGTGVMRVTLAGNDTEFLQAVWLDKRNPSSGYAVWGTRIDSGKSLAGPNKQVQDELGSAVPQWHASVTRYASGFVSTWDDSRENWSDENEVGDVFISWQTDDGWSEDLLVPGASGEGYQGSPVITVDRFGDMHLAWIEREGLTGPTVLKYLRGTYRP